MRRTLLALALGLAVTAAQAHDTDARPGHDIDKVNGGITAESGQTYGDLNTVNGGIHINSGATVDEAETVNGGIDIADDAKVGSAEAVNGAIKIGQRVTIGKGVETVNGGIHVGFLSRIGGDLETVNGTIMVQQSEVAGRIHTVQGDITVGAKSHVRNGIWVEKNNHGTGWNFRPTARIPRIVIGPNAVVDGELRFEREVELFVHPTAKIGTVTGATAKAYTDTLPPRAE